MKAKLFTRLGRLEERWKIPERKTRQEVFVEVQALATRRNISLEEALGIVCRGISSISEFRRLTLGPDSEADSESDHL